MEALTLTELKRLCEQRGLVVGGNKGELIERLTTSSKSRPISAKSKCTISNNAHEVAPSTLFPSEYDALTIPQLKDLCRKRLLPVGGIKDDLLARLRASDPRNMNLNQLKDRCRDAGVPVTGTKSDLIDRVIKAMENGDNATKSAAQLQKIEAKIPVSKLKRMKNDSPKNKPLAPTKPSVERGFAPQQEQRNHDDPYTRLTIAQLKEIARQRGFPVGGSKDELVTRLRIGVSSAPSGNSTKPTDRVAAPVTSTGSQRPQSLTTTSHKPKLRVEGVTGKKRKTSTSVETIKSERVDPPKTIKFAQFAHAQATKYGAQAAIVKKEEVSQSPTLSSKATTTPPAQPQRTPTSNCYLVVTLEPSNVTGFVAVFSTKAAANARVRQEFYEMHPDGWSQDDFATHVGAVQADYNGEELLTLSLQAPHAMWSVRAVRVPADSAAVTTMRECYLVCSLQSIVGRDDSIHNLQLVQLFTTKHAANTQMHKVFYEQCPWQWSHAQFHDQGKPWASAYDGLESLCKVGDRDELWQAEVMAVSGGDAPPRQQWFIVQSITSFRQARHGPHRDAVYEFYAPVKTKQEANTLAEQVFYRENPWSWAQGDFHGKPVKTKYHQGRLLEMAVRENDTWTVRVVAVPEDAQVSETDPASGTVVYGLCGRENQCGRGSRDPKMKIKTVVYGAGGDVVANRVEQVFYKNNPYGWSRDEFHERSCYETWCRPEIHKGSENGFPTMAIAPSGNESWSVRCKAFNQKPLKVQQATTSVAPVPAKSSGSVAAKQPLQQQRVKTEAFTSDRKPAQLKRVTKPTGDWFLVYSKNARFPYEGPEFQFFPLLPTKEEANAMVKHVYYKENPWGWTRADFTSNQYSEKATESTHHDGLLTLSMCDEEEWTVQAIHVPAGFQVPTATDPASVIVIYSLFGYLPDGFHSPEEQEMKIQAIVSSRETATTRVKQIFHEKHSYEWSIAELTAPREGYGGGLGASRAEISKTTSRDGLLSMEIHPDDDESWSVHAQKVQALGKDERGGFVVYESDDEDEEEEEEEEEEEKSWSSSTDSDDGFPNRRAY